MMRTFVLCLMTLVPTCGCGGPPKDDASAVVTLQHDDQIVVYAVSYPLTYFAERIGGEDVDVHFPAPGGIDPAYWVPDAETMVAYQGADLILLNGAGYAGWTDVASLPSSALVDTSVSITDQLIDIEGAVTHSHGPDGDHAHAERAFTTWLDPVLAIEQARAVSLALATVRPEKEERFQEAFSSLKADLTALDDRLSVAAERLDGCKVVFSHPVYQYLQRRYGLDGVSLHWEPGEIPDSGAWGEFDEIIDADRICGMLWEASPGDPAAAELRSRGVEFGVFDPCGNRPETGDYLTVMNNNAAALESLF